MKTSITHNKYFTLQLKEHNDSISAKSTTLLLSLTPFSMGFLRAAHGWVGAKKAPLPKTCHTYPTMMKLGTVIPYLKKIQKIYESCDTPLGFC